MKKIMFTAIALVAFSSVSMANTIADDEVVKENEIKKVMLREIPCPTAWSIAYHYARQAGQTEQEAIAIAFAAYDRCLGCPE
ncbi:hypothetical protein [Flavobacterium sp.]|uniref:hypothetical protein n=1 Tax=Flavobacterium sp. TaxID=239 RepID=UPI0026032F7E|nr:hypothetical protein [Flavobacterium sp.]